MKLVVFGLTVSSSWGNGHATLWRGLCRALAARSHEVVFFERDVPYYRAARDLTSLPSGRLILYDTFESVLPEALSQLRSADVAIVTSYCPDGRDATNLLLSNARGLRVFYDLDTPETLSALELGPWPAYLDQRGLSGFDLVLSFTGGRALEELKLRLGARRVETLYGHVDPTLHRPVAQNPCFAGALSYLGTYAEDRQALFDELFVAAATARPEERFVLGGSMYPDVEALPKNVVYFSHLAPASHAEFFASSRFTLNLTRGNMKRFGFCPSGRLFEAAASGAPLLSDWFEGLDRFFEPGSELVVVRDCEDVLRALALSDSARSKLARNARRRVLSEHTAEHRAEQLESILDDADRQRRSTQGAPARTAES
jgi:spore maturation protein CgeB